jgi:hypothetical protein
VKKVIKNQGKSQLQHLKFLCFLEDTSTRPQDFLSKEVEIIVNSLTIKLVADPKSSMKAKLEHIFKNNGRYVYEKEMLTYV